MSAPEKGTRTNNIVWDSRYNVGIEELDEQHQQLLRLINELDEFVEAGGKHIGKPSCFEALNALIKYADTHFRTEERYMEQHGYPMEASQREKHSDFMDRIFELTEESQKGDLLAFFKITNFLKNWYISHVLGMDQEYKDFLVSKGVTTGQ
jgi:hemerythrin